MQGNHFHYVFSFRVSKTTASSDEKQENTWHGVVQGALPGLVCSVISCLECNRHMIFPHRYMVHGLVKNCRTKCSCLQGDSAAPAESERAAVRHIRCGGSILTLFGGASNIMNQRPLTRALLGSMFQDSVASLP